MRQVVQMANVIALELETGAVLGALAQYGFDILVGILEDQVAAVFQVLSFPFMLEGLEAIQHGKQAEIHGTHVQRGHLGFEGHGRSRSEEHTSELQSLMRISYAVFCLKKKTN